MKTRIYLCGQKAFGAAVLEAVVKAGYPVIGVCSPVYRSPYDEYDAYAPEDAKPDRTRSAAERLQIPWSKSGTLKASTLPDGVDVIIAAHSYDFISRKTLLRARLGGIGYHPSLLPRHRGRDAIRWAVKMGDPVTGGSVYWLNDSVDSGPIAARDWCFIAPGETPEHLWRNKLQPMGIRLILKVLGDIEAGRLIRIPQEEENATWEPGWERPPLFRPDLPMIGGGLDEYVVVTERWVNMTDV